IKRAQLEGVPVILGSATPSLETWNNAIPTPGPSSGSLPVAPSATPAPASSPSIPAASAGTAAPAPSPGTPGEGWDEGSAPQDKRRTLAESPHPASPGVPGEERRPDERAFAGDVRHLAPTRGEGVQSPDNRARFHLLELPHRVRGLQLPSVELIDMRNEARL